MTPFSMCVVAELLTFAAMLCGHKVGGGSGTVVGLRDGCAICGAVNHVMFVSQIRQITCRCYDSSRG